MIISSTDPAGLDRLHEDNADINCDDVRSRGPVGNIHGQEGMFA